MGNVTGEFLALPDPLLHYQTLWPIVLAIAIVLIRGAKMLMYRTGDPNHLTRMQLARRTVWSR